MDWTEISEGKSTDILQLASSTLSGVGHREMSRKISTCAELETIRTNHCGLVMDRRVCPCTLRSLWRPLPPTAGSSSDNVLLRSETFEIRFLKYILFKLGLSQMNIF